MQGARQTSALRAIRTTDAAEVRLFCFPYAGAGPSIFNEWKARLPASVDLVGVVYPGRECRATEPPVRDLRQLIGSLAGEFQAYLDKPFAFFGHSMGAYVSFELAMSLSRDGIAPGHLFISGAGAPHLPEPNRIHHLPNPDFLRQLLKLNGFPAEVLRSPELVRYALPILRADFTACENYRFEADAPIRCPMTVFGGNNDIRVDRSRLEAWKHLSAVAFSLQLFEGDHFYLRQQKDALLECVARQLALVAR